MKEPCLPHPRHVIPDTGGDTVGQRVTAVLHQLHPFCLKIEMAFMDLKGKLKPSPNTSKIYILRNIKMILENFMYFNDFNLTINKIFAIAQKMLNNGPKFPNYSIPAERWL